MPNFTEVFDDVKRNVALAQDSRDGLNVTPILLLGPQASAKPISSSSWPTCWTLA
ncbi:MAG: ATP-dependent Lon protease [Rhodoferax sp.]|jgi:ATP-dependent Lon protease